MKAVRGEMGVVKQIMAQSNTVRAVLGGCVSPVYRSAGYSQLWCWTFIRRSTLVFFLVPSTYKFRGMSTQGPKHPSVSSMTSHPVGLHISFDSS